MLKSQDSQIRNDFCSYSLKKHDSSWITYFLNKKKKQATYSMTQNKNQKPCLSTSLPETLITDEYKAQA